MGVETLNLHFGNRADGLSVDPEPDWVLDDLISELNALELKLPEPSALELKLTAPTLAEPTPSMTQSRELNTGKGIYGCDTFVMHVLDGDLEDSENDDDNSTDQHLITGRRFSCADLDFTRELNTGKGIYGCDTFVMHVLDGDLEDSENDDDNRTDQHLITGRRFSCADLDFTSDSEGTDDELDLERTENCVMDKTGLVEGFLFELERERQLRVKEEIREKISALEADLRTENERSASVLILVKEDEEARREADRKLDKQHQRKIAQARDTQLSAVQRDHEQKSQIEEWKIRKDAAIEEAKRKEKERQEIAKAEAEARLKEKVAEEAQKASLDAERKAAVEVAQREALQRAAAEAAEKEAAEQKNRAMKETAGEAKEGIKIKVAENAKKLEAERLRKSMVYAEQNQSLRMGTNKDFRSYERQIDVRIRQIAWSQEIVREKSTELMKIIKDPLCPQSISILAFAMKVLSHIENKAGSLNNIAFALGHVIVLVTSQVPVAMDLILAEFHKACIYTVPKHIYYSKSAFKTELDYYKMIGYREDDGKIETTDSYLGRMKSYMMIYAALVQTEISGIINLHGLKEGWAWIARFLNELPATQSTAVALEAFLKIAGFALYWKYRVQFMKILNIISNEFLVSLKQQGDRPKGVIHSIETYLETKQYLEEPQGRNLPPYVESRSLHA